MKLHRFSYRKRGRWARYHLWHPTRVQFKNLRKQPLPSKLRLFGIRPPYILLDFFMRFVVFAIYMCGASNTHRETCLGLQSFSAVLEQHIGLLIQKSTIASSSLRVLFHLSSYYCFLCITFLSFRFLFLEFEMKKWWFRARPCPKFLLFRIYGKTADYSSYTHHWSNSRFIP